MRRQEPMRNPALALGEFPLKGVSLIEASAGTGKTWSIASLYVRLLLDALLPVERILVVTYTNAATEELRGRIAARLREVRDALRAPSVGRLAASADALLAHLGSGPRDYRRDCLRIELALESFEQSAIHTIHGFCQRALSDAAFESGEPFETELITNEAALAVEIAADFWRREMAGGTAHHHWTDWLVAKGITPERLAEAARESLQRPYASLRGPELGMDPSTPGAHAAYANALAQVASVWRTEARAIVSLVLAAIEAGNLHRGSYKPDGVTALAEELAQTLSAWNTPHIPNAMPELPAKLQLYSRATLAERTIKGRTPPRHIFFDQVERLIALKFEAAENYQTLAAEMLMRFHGYLHPELERRKRDRGQVSYNDLLGRLAQALRAHSGETLALKLREHYAAALVDEFQDSDPLQYEIFKRVFAHPETLLVCVGDPKQAIYGFRGADITTYLNARDDAMTTHTLDTNRRSDRALVAAVNALFASGSRPFIAADISFAAVHAADQAVPALRVEGDPAEPFVVWFAERGNGGSAYSSVDPAARAAANATAAEIARLLACAAAGRARIGERALRGNDIVVLVQTHDQARRMKQALAEQGVASVSYGEVSVFDSVEALEIERILAAVAAPHQEGLVRAALVTSLFGVSGDELWRLISDERAWERRMQSFADYHEIARSHGFARMWREIGVREHVPARLLGLPDGERRMTNLLHLGELLQEAALAEGLDLAGVGRWLARSRSPGHASYASHASHASLSKHADPEARQLRLESDEELPRIVTIHASKGLEYGIVFCPFLWHGGRAAAQKRGVLDVVAAQAEGPDGSSRHTVIDVGSTDFERHQESAERARFAECLRLAYVALTRAKYRCTIVWGALPSAARSALAWLLHAGDSDAHASSLAERFKRLNDDDLRADLARLAARAEGGIRIDDLPRHAPTSRAVARADDSFSMTARPFRGHITPAWRVNSFSALMADRADEAPDYDSFTLAAPIAAAAEGGSRRDIFGFPRGLAAGTMIHALFESMDFTRPHAATTLIEQKLGEFGFEPTWAPVLQAMLIDVAATPLDSDGRLTLGRIKVRQRLSEMEFSFPVNDGQLDRFAALLGRESLMPARGFMKGFIDAVIEHEGRYSIVDYKSNWLGDMPEAYAPSALKAVMKDAYYDVQLAIYTVALHRFLRSRIAGYDYDRHMGDVLYLFVRGMSPRYPAGNGVYRTRLARSLVDALDRMFEGRE